MWQAASANKNAMVATGLLVATIAVIPLAYFIKDCFADANNPNCCNDTYSNLEEHSISQEESLSAT